ncbi:hypothetical protein MYP_1498 [Sporocytophaga myxococcoides]|uniref:Uncharacterized protein n=1 Tax=Sporocytophaga myxococcoides TaxID=153721 RepID=A0A098LBJ8_9BACT|nr:hypothetical protein MYP_1498 [Sporocytophaga myxococcoides]
MGNIFFDFFEKVFDLKKSVFCQYFSFRIKIVLNTFNLLKKAYKLFNVKRKWG